VQPKEVGHKEEYYKIIHDEYTKGYLEALGVQPTEGNRALVAQHAPLENCIIEPSWNDYNVVAQSIRILQPSIHSTARFVHEDAVGLDGLIDKHAPIRMVPVDIPDVANQAGVPKWAAPSGKENKTLDISKAQALAGIQEHLEKHSANANLTLAEELQHSNMQRPNISGSQQTKGIGKRAVSAPFIGRSLEAQDVELENLRNQELAQLKTKYVLPFACERLEADGTSNMVHWSLYKPVGPHRITMPEEHEDLSTVFLAISADQIAQEAKHFAQERAPIELLTMRRDPGLFSQVRQHVCSADTVRVIGLLSHLLYWDIIGPHVPAAQQLPEDSKCRAGP